MAEPAGRGGFAALDPCVHCGFCLSACPTYLVTGDENASPRGRIVLMRALERGELPATDPGVREHLDSCLGCRGCEPVCPSGVGYGSGLEEARARLAAANGIGWRAAALLAAFARAGAARALFGVARWLRASGLAAALGRLGGAAFPLGMVAATRPWQEAKNLVEPRSAGDAGTVALFRGCVMDGLFQHVHDATRRVLAVNGYRVIEVDTRCCGALHQHAGDEDGARALAAANVAALSGQLVDWIAVNSAGCGALLRHYVLVAGPGAAGVATRVRDVTELLAARGPLPGAPLPLDVCYDAPCHLQHAQGVHAEPLAVLRSIPGLRLRLLPGFDRCCGSAGLYGILHPGLSRAVLAEKLEAIRAASPRPAVAATGNPGCLMQIGAGLLAQGDRIRTAHPVELLDRSYALAGLYR